VNKISNSSGSWSFLRIEKYYRAKEKALMMAEQAQKIKHKAVPEWAEGLYYNKGIFSEALVYHDEESIYFECRGKDSGVVRYTFEMIEGLKIVEEEEHEDSSK
jgi:hypothetical protein